MYALKFTRVLFTLSNRALHIHSELPFVGLVDCMCASRNWNEMTIWTAFIYVHRAFYLNRLQLSAVFAHIKANLLKTLAAPFCVLHANLWWSDALLHPSIQRNSQLTAVICFFHSCHFMVLLNETFFNEYGLLCHLAHNLYIKIAKKKMLKQILAHDVWKTEHQNPSPCSVRIMFWLDFIYYMSFKRLALFINSLRTENENEMSFVDI